jgi:TonB-linked SusC/RagA family outer membrane protein
MKKTLLIKFSRFLLLFLFPVALYAQTGSVTGTVVDVSGDPLIGVNVIVQGTTNGSVTNLDGKYTIPNLNLEVVNLEVSFIGYLNEKYSIDLSKTANAILDVVLLEDIKELSEIVVIGYGTQKKSDLTSAVASVSAEDLEQSRAASIQEALQGRAAGVQVSSNSGAPGSAVSIKIRGITSINGTDPIWIVDGVGADPNSVNASDIESMEILKDASSAAIYGANAGSGVILITTKKGKPGDTKVTFNSYWGVQQAANKVNVTSGPQFAKMYHEYQVLANARASNYLTTQPDTFQTYNYQDMIFQKAMMKNYDLGVSGGNEKSTFYMGVGYLSQEGILKSSAYEKLSIRINGEHAANKWLKVGLNTNYSNKIYTGFQEWELKDEYASPILAALAYHSWVPPYGEKTTDSKYDDGWSFTPLGNTGNPLAMVNLKNRESRSQNGSATFYGKVTPIDAISFESRLTGNVGFGNSMEFAPIYFVTPSNKNDISSIAKGSDMYSGWLFQNLLTFNKSFFDVHNLSALAGMESGYSISEWSNATRLDLYNQDREMWYYNGARNDTAVSQIPDGTASEEAGYSYLGRVSYDYMGMILGQFNVRKDYSSKFGPNKRSGIFPSFSAGFKFTELDIVRNTLPFMNFGKIRYGWGIVGNNSVSPYQYYSTVGGTAVNSYSYNNMPVTSSGLAPDKFVNRSIHWEEVQTSNLGLDFGFLDYKFSVSIDYFERHNNGMLMTVESPWMAGWRVTDVYQETVRNEISDPTKNIGQINNKGIELALGWKEKRGMFNYGANLNFTYINTYVGKIEPDTLYQGTTKGIGSNLTRTMSNQPFDIFYGYVTDGLFRLSDSPNEEGICTNQPYTVNPDGEIEYAQPGASPGDFKFKDTNGDGKLGDDDMVPLGSPHPKFTLGLNLYTEVTLPQNLGMVDVKAFFQGAFGHKIFNATKFYLYNTDGGFNWGEDYYNDHYTVELYDRNDELVTPLNDGATYPRIDPIGSNENFTRLSDFYIEDGSYVRLKNIEIGYTLPATISKMAHISRIRVYFAAKNMLTFTKYSGLDPEVGSTRNAQGFSDPRSAVFDKAAYSTAKMYSCGLNVTF